MAPKDDPAKLLDGVLPQGPQIDPANPSTWPLPAPAAGGQARGASPVEVRRRELRQIATEMRKDLATLRSALGRLQAGSPAAGRIGGWDVAQQLGHSLDTAHGNMVRSVHAYCEAYNAVINRLEWTATNLEKAEQGATEAAKRPQLPTHVTPWQNR
jgi:hypothetical protein